MPKISVIMPVYNAEPFLREAIDSILAQTFTDFELLLIDDGSTDNSRSIIDSYCDDRIKCVPNLRNEGIVASLNKGVSVAKGEYIAIMHADDVSLPQRLEIQGHYLDTHPAVSMVAVKATFVSATGIERDAWMEDQSTTTFDQIRKLLPKTNCIVHPAVMIRSVVARAYAYNKKQHATEDYDLWLRLAADNKIIEKIDCNLLEYRVHQDSITARSTAKVGDYKEVIAKSKFLLEAAKIPKCLNTFHFEVLTYLIRDFFRISTNYAKVYFLAIARNIFIFLGKPLGAIYQKFFAPPHEVLLFLSFSINQIGGAERVHADVVASNINKAPWVILANEWNDEPVQSEENMSYRFSSISKLLRNPFTKNLTIGFFAGYLNRSKSVAFGGNSEFFYWLVPHLDPAVCCVDFVHGFGCLIEIISLPHVPRINRRIVITEELRKDLAELYRNNGVPSKYLERIHMIDYGIDVPEMLLRDETRAKLHVIYVGRGTEEKRVHLVGRIARLLATRNLPVTVSLIGDVREVVAVEDQKFCTFWGPVYDRNTLNGLYNKSDVLVITSRTEGLSLVRMEAMAHGVVPIAVAVGAIPGHIQNGVTGFLISPNQPEEGIVEDFCRTIEGLINDKQRLHQISSQAYEFAKCHFDRFTTLRSFSKMFNVPSND